MPALQQKMKVQVKGNKEDEAGHQQPIIDDRLF